MPAPATAELLKGAPVYTSGIVKELVTPTGAAIATTLATRYSEIPEMTLSAIGYGAGSADLTEKANVLRILIGENAVSEPGEYWDAPVTVIETNIDDMSPQIYGYFVGARACCRGFGRVFRAGADEEEPAGAAGDDFGRAGKRRHLIDLLFRETTTSACARMRCGARRSIGNRCR